MQAEAGARVYNVQVINSKTGYYEPIDLEKTYTVASTNLVLLEGEGGMTMFEGAEVVSNTGILDVEILEKYITEDLEGVIPAAYQRVTIHVAFTEGETYTHPSEDQGNGAIVIGVLGVVLAIATIVTVRIIRKRRGL